MQKQYSDFLEILKKEVTPALGCTVTSIAYAAAEAASAVGGTPKKVHIIMDRHQGTKGCDVGIPNTSLTGVEILAAIGAIAGDAEAKLNVLHNVTPEDEAAARQFVLDGNVQIDIDFETRILGLFMDCTVETDKGIGRSVIVKTHTNLVRKEANGKVLVDIPYDRIGSMDETHDPMASYTIGEFYSFATEVPVEELYFLREAVTMNNELADSIFTGEAVGAGFALSMMKRCNGDMIKKAKARTAAGSEARMSGFSKPAMSCATSGNVGITASLPLISLAEDLGASEEQLLRALAMSFLTTICVKNRIGRVSSMCACVVAASQGIAAGACMLMGGDLEAINRAANTTAINVFGVVCDGARLACAMKLASAAGTAIESAQIAMDGCQTPPGQGVCGIDADDTINFMGSFAQNGMKDSDLELCKALYAKREKRIAEGNLF